MTPGDGFVVGSPGAEAAVEVAHQAVAEGAEGLVVQVTGGAPCVVELAATRARAQRAQRPLVGCVGEPPVADEARLHGALASRCYAERHTYPGNPDPLAFGEDGKRGAVVATIDAAGQVTSERHMVAQTTVHDIEVDISGYTTQQQIRDALAEQVDGRGGFARLIVRGDIAPEISVTESDLRDAMGGFDAVQIRLGALRPGYDFEALRIEPTVRGQFVADVLSAGLDAVEERRVLIAGLRALEGRRDVEVL